MTPLHKKGDIDDTSNYRPISIVPIFSKILEAVIKKRFLQYIELNDLFSHEQHGFREGKSTTTAMVQFVDVILSALEEGSLACVTLCDLSKAFDCVVHDILLDKLKHYNIAGNALNIIRTYLSNRTQFVEIDNGRSTLRDITYGVPQGSVLGPILFIMYINDLSSSSIDTNLVLYADDATLINWNKDANQVQSMSSEAERQAEEFFASIKLKMNTDKTQRITISLKTVNVNSDPVKLLGFYIDSKLTWNAHTTNLSKKLASNTFLLRKLSCAVTSDMVRTAYFAFFHSHLQYGVIIWGHCANKDNIFRMRKAAVRIIAGQNSRTHCRPFFIQYQILTLPCIQTTQK